MDAIEYHKKLKGKIEVISRSPIKNREDLSLAYTPGVAEACLEIVKNPESIYSMTRKNNLVAVITDGTAVLGLGDIGPEASLPVMEGKCVLLKEFAGVDGFPLALKTTDVEEFIRTVELLSPIFGGINLEDISAPRCFEIEQRLSEKLDIPVFHDDQHGTAIVVLAGLLNALKVVHKNIEDISIVVNGVGAAGVAITKLLLLAGVGDIVLVDSTGLVCDERTNLNWIKEELLKKTNKRNICGDLSAAVADTDVFIGVSKEGLLKPEMVKTMNHGAIIFALANPEPEIMPDSAKKAGAAVIATGRSDFPNQVNNVLAFPGIFRGLLDNKISTISEEMKIRVAYALANYVKEPNAEQIMPDPLDKNVAKVVAHAVKG